jgi:Domain of unknown function (DUF4956)
MPPYAILIADLFFISLLTFGIYFPRHRRKDLVVAYVGVNIGVLAVSTVLSSSTVSFGLGLGLFGVLSIIRLRSYEIDQNEIAYYFSALALGLLAGLSPELNLVVIGLMIVIVGAMFVADHPRLYKGYKQELVVLDKAYPVENEMIAALSEMLNADVKKATIKRLDFVNDSTWVDVRYKNR